MKHPETNKAGSKANGLPVFSNLSVDQLQGICISFAFGLCSHEISQERAIELPGVQPFDIGVCIFDSPRRYPDEFNGSFKAPAVGSSADEKVTVKESQQGISFLAIRDKENSYERNFGAYVARV